ncbi:MAG: hypothetical protein K2X11_09845, partial [Acetobacteraceae bacterium]|nr:hypothetical protein [Acetobacteraceae bacterium]
MNRRILLLALPGAVAACAAQPLPPAEPGVRLPRDAVEGAGDPTRAAILQASFGFGQTPPFAGNPADAARGIAHAEFLRNALISDPRYQRPDSLAAVRFAQARPEWRAALGIPAEAPAQPVIDALYAFGRQPSSPLPAGLFAPDAAQRLAALPPLPQTA